MNWLKTALTGIGKFVVNLTKSEQARQKAVASLERAGEIATTLYPIVEKVAALTPNRTDDEIVAAINSFGVMGLVDPKADKTDALHNIVLAVAQRVQPGVANSILSLAIETAYQAFKANANPNAA